MIAVADVLCVIKTVRESNWTQIALALVNLPTQH